METIEKYSARNIEARDLEVSRIYASSLNPRKHFDEDAVKELGLSILEHGLLEPIVVRPEDRSNYTITNGKSGGKEVWFLYDNRRFYTDEHGAKCYEGLSEQYDFEIDAEKSFPRYSIIAGERRWRAAQYAGLPSVPCRVMYGIDDRKALELALVENLVRRDIDPIEEAMGYKQLTDMGYKQSEIAEKVNRSQPVIANAIRLLALPDEVHQHVRDGKLTVSHARALVSWIEYPELFAAQLEYALSGATTKELEKLDYGRACTLERKKLLVSEWNSSISFDWRNVCADCKHRRETHSDNLTCLDPECFKAKQKEAVAQKLKAAEEAAKEGGDIPNVHDLHDCKLLAYGPKDCKTDCEHRIKARDWRGDITEACADLDCWTRMKKEQEEKEAVEKQRLIDEQYAKITSLIDQAEGGYVRALVPICLQVIRNTDACHVDTVAKRLNVEIDAKVITNYNTDIYEAYNILEKLSPVVLIMLTAEARMLEDVTRSYRKESALWFIGEIPQKVEDGPFDDSEEDEDE